MKTFLKKEEVELVNGGYLSSKETKKPIFHKGFVEAQEHANYIVTLAAELKGKNLKGTEPVNISEIKRKVSEKLSKSKAINFIEKPKEIERKTTDSLREEALKFVKYQEDVSKSEKVNQFLQKFKDIHEYELNGLFFSNKIVKLDKIYTISEIKTAVNSVIDLLD